MIKPFVDFIVEGVNDPSLFKVIYLCGPAGAGKSYIANKVTAGLGLRTVNSDETFEHMLRKANIDMDFNKMDSETEKEAQAIRKSSRKKMFKRKDNYIEGRLGMVIDSPGTKYNFIADDVATLEALGYDCMMIFCAVKMQTAKDRNASRERKIPSANLESDYKSIMGNIKQFERLFGDNFILINSENTNQEIFDKVWKRVKKFTEAPVTNRAALKWIDRQQNPEKYKKREIKQQRLDFSFKPRKV